MFNAHLRTTHSGGLTYCIREGGGAGVGVWGFVVWGVGGYEGWGLGGWGCAPNQGYDRLPVAFAFKTSGNLSYPSFGHPPPPPTPPPNRPNSPPPPFWGRVVMRPHLGFWRLRCLLIMLFKPDAESLQGALALQICTWCMNKLHNNLCPRAYHAMKGTYLRVRPKTLLGCSAV